MVVHSALGGKVRYAEAISHTIHDVRLGVSRSNTNRTTLAESIGTSKLCHACGWLLTSRFGLPGQD